MIYEAIAYKIMVTKRDMYYRDVSLFGTQSVVDIASITCISLKKRFLNCITQLDYRRYLLSF